MDSPRKTFRLLEALSEYTAAPLELGEEAKQTALLSLADSLGCAILSLNYKACKKLLGPYIPGTIVPEGCRVPGTSYVLDPIHGAFNLGAMIRWLDFNDTWLAKEWGHPSDNFGSLIALSDHVSQKKIRLGKEPVLVKTLLEAAVKAYEIQGILCLENSYNRLGIDHVAFVKVASAAVSTWLLDGTKEQIIAALSQAFIDLAPLRTYRHAPNTGPRKSWAAGDATSRGLQLAWMTMQGEPGYPQALEAPRWGLFDAIFKGARFRLTRPLGTYVMENILFKVAYPAEFHAQTAVECAIKLHSPCIDRLEEISWIELQTQESAVRIIDKSGPLKNPADRDHCLQYMVAIGLLYGNLTADHYEDKVAQDPRIDALRAKMKVREYPPFSLDYLHPSKRSIANAIKVHFKDGTTTERVVVEYPLGHRRRREEAIPLLFHKLQRNLATIYPKEKVDSLIDLFQSQERLFNMPVSHLMDLFHLTDFRQ